MKKPIVFLLLFLVGLGLGYYWGFSSKSESNPETNVYASNARNTQTKTQKTANGNTDNQVIPAKVLMVLENVRNNNSALEGYVGGRKFKNLEGLLPKKTAEGNRINYREWDVNPHTEGKNRGAERLVTGDDGNAYFTNDHYRSFTKID